MYRKSRIYIITVTFTQNAVSRCYSALCWDHWNQRENADTVHRCVFNQWSHENVRALPPYGKKLVDWHVPIRTVCIQLQKFNVILSVFRKDMSNWHNRDKSWICYVLLTWKLVVSPPITGSKETPHCLYLSTRRCFSPYKEPNQMASVQIAWRHSP